MASKAPRKKKSIDFSKPVGNVIDPYQMTEDERHSEVSEILIKKMKINKCAIYKSFQKWKNNIKHYNFLGELKMKSFRVHNSKVKLRQL
jgi:hypothetical protein